MALNQVINIKVNRNLQHLHSDRYRDKKFTLLFKFKLKEDSHSEGDETSQQKIENIRYKIKITAARLQLLHVNCIGFYNYS